jgi:hypothetical protein
MRLIATDIVEGVTVELYPYGKLLDLIKKTIDTMTTARKKKEETTHTITDLKHSDEEKYGLLVIGLEKKNESETE